MHEPKTVLVPVTFLFRTAPNVADERVRRLAFAAIEHGSVRDCFHEATAGAEIAVSYDGHIEPPTLPAGRHASSQAWRRLRKHIGPGEARGLAADIAAVTGSNPADVEYALTTYPWDQKSQV